VNIQTLKSEAPAIVARYLGKGVTPAPKRASYNPRPMAGAGEDTKPKPKPRVAVDHRGRALAPRYVEEAVAMRARGLLIAEIAEKLGVSQSWVSKALKGARS
jgi:DNA-directed RNA polymerase specialized sigma24 family protein